MKRNLAEKFKEEHGADIVNRAGNARYHDDEWGVQFNNQDEATKALVAVAIDVGRDLGNQHCSGEELTLAEDLEEQLEKSRLHGVGLFTVIG